jgi:C4-dicarboxylate transporter, DctM subunit
MENGNKLSALHKVEDYFAFGALCLMVALLVVKVLLFKLFNAGLELSGIIQHLVLWVALLGGMITSRQHRHLAMASGIDMIRGNAKKWVSAGVNLLACAVSAALACASLGFILTVFDPGQKVFYIPIQAVCAVLPIGFTVITARFLLSIEGTAKRLIFGTIGIIIGIVLGGSALLKAAGAIAAFSGGADSAFVSIISGFHEKFMALAYPYIQHLMLPLILLLIASAFAGAPIFVVLAGLALFLFYNSSGIIESVPDSIYYMLIGNLIPAIPLFTFSGFILSESRAGKRFVNLMRALFGSIPGGHAITTVILCALFTTLTGGSGVTILALGALLLYVLRRNGYEERFSLGLLVSSGSSGLHFPPSLPLILYGVVTEMDIKQLFVGGLLPGTLLVVALSIFGAQHAIRKKIKTYPFSIERVGVFVRGAIWEILFPVIIIVSYFSGFTSLVDTSAIACVYVIIVYVFIKRDIRLSDLPKVVVKSMPVIGGVLLLYACALAFKSFIIDAQLPGMLADWMSSVVKSKYLFLLILNVALLLAGFFTESISAILVIAPLIVPLGQAYGINPVHLGIIFIANLELGFLMPPFGMNLFLASYRLNQPVTKIYRSVVPFFIVMLVCVLIITYVPWLSTGLLGIVKF